MDSFPHSSILRSCRVYSAMSWHDSLMNSCSVLLDAIDKLPNVKVRFTANKCSPSSHPPLVILSSVLCPLSLSVGLSLAVMRYLSHVSCIPAAENVAVRQRGMGRTATLTSSSCCRDMSIVPMKQHSNAYPVPWSICGLYIATALRT